MRVIGLDAGSTSVCGVLLNTATADVEHTISREHFASASDAQDIQDPSEILATVRGVLSELVATAAGLHHHGDRSEPVAGLALTGQVHGILYVDHTGTAVSPLYTWQDTRGRLPRADGRESWADWAHRVTGRRLPNGYGLLTHCVNVSENNVPRQTTRLTTILGYLGMQLASASTPVIDHTDAHSLGLYLPDRETLDTEALARLGISPTLLPGLAPSGERIGTTPEAIPVIAAVGDNQAGFVGAVRDSKGSALISVGTSAQLSVHIPEDEASALLSPADLKSGWIGELEIRPFPGGGHLLAGASLSGGNAYRMLESLFREVCRRYAGSDPPSLLDAMNTIPYGSLEDELKLDVSVRFHGTRTDPGATGSISGIQRGNLTVDYLVEGVLRGIARELYGFWRQVPHRIRNRTTRIVAVGNAVRRNHLLQRILTEVFGVPVSIPRRREEAAVGAAVVAGVGVGAYADYGAERRLFEYE